VGGSANSSAAASANTGSGGGGGASGNFGGVGGSGIAVVKYLGPQRATGGTYSLVGGFSIHTFTTSGNLQT
jgi:hypothetical protein